MKTGDWSGGMIVGRWRNAVCLTIAVSVIFASVGPDIAAGQQARVTDEQIQSAIDRGVEAILALQQDDGLWSKDGKHTHYGRMYPGSMEVCAMLALAYAGVSMNDEKMQKGFDALLEIEMMHTYTVSFRLIVLAKLFDKLDRNQQMKARHVAQRDVNFLVAIQKKSDGSWGYPNYEDNKNPDVNRMVKKDNWFDFSNTQIAVLGLSEAMKMRIEIPPIVLKKAQDLYLQHQLADGGWNYGHKSSANRNCSYGAMTAAAVASLILTRDSLYPGLGCPCTGDRSRGRIAVLDASLEKGFEWLGKHFAVNTHPTAVGTLPQFIPYWLYACERVGLAGGIKYFGGHDWYAEGAAWFLKKQGRNGMWGTIDDTAFAICFLVKGRAPILFNKLQFKGVWNSHPQDLANLVDYVGRQKEQLMQWQVITLEAPVAEWHDAPILFITAESALEFTDEEKAKLREFTDTGGTIFFESSCGNREATQSWRTLVEELWPQYELQRLDDEHPLFSSDRQMKRRPPGMLGMNDGVRTFMFVTFSDISCVWAMNVVGPQRQAWFDLGMNMYTYAADRRPLRARLASVFHEPRYQSRVTAGPRDEMKIAWLKHGGDWSVADNYKPLERLAEQVSQKAQIKLEIAEPQAPSTLPDDVDIAYLTGRQGVMLLDSETAALTKFVDRGGMLLINATMGEKNFDMALRKTAAAAGLTLKQVDKDHPLLSGKFDGAEGYDVRRVEYKFNLRRERIGLPEPVLYLLMRGKQVVGVYSPFDLMYAQTGCDAFDNRGYETDDARAILTNIMLLMSVEEKAAATE